MKRKNGQLVSKFWRCVLCVLIGMLLGVKGWSAEFDEGLVEPMAMNGEVLESYTHGLGDYHLAYLFSSEADQSEVVKERKAVEARIRFDDYIRRARQAAETNQALANRLQDLGLEALDEVQRSYREMVEAFGNSPRRPIWLTNMAELKLQQILQIKYGFASESCRYGVPTRVQEIAYAEVVREAFFLLAEADASLYKLQTRLPRSPGFAALKTRGLPGMLFDEYAAKRVPFYLGIASIYVATLPADDIYFTGEYDKTNSLLIRKETIEAERKRLLGIGLGRLDGFVTDQGDVAGVRFSAMLHASYALFMREEYQSSIQLLQPLLRSQRRDLTTLGAQMLYAHALAKSDVRTALGELRRLQGSHPIVIQSPIFKLMVVDAMFRVQVDNLEQLRRGQDGESALGQAFNVYYELIESPSLSEMERQQISYMVAQRFERLVAYVDDVNQMPARVRMLMTDYGLQQMQEAIARGEQNVEGSELNRYYRLILDLAKSLDEVDVEPEVRARVGYNAAIAMYLPDKQSMENLQEVANILAELAKKFPQQSVSVKAITFATETLQHLHQKYPDVGRIGDDYADAAETLFNAFSVSKAADNQRVYYAFYLLQGKGQYAAAAGHYKLVPFDHPQYYDAQRELMFCYDAQISLKQQANQNFDILLEAMNADARRILREVSKEDKNIAERSGKAQIAEAVTVMLQAAGMEMRGAYADAVALLDESDVDFEAYSNLLPRVLQVRISALIGLQQLSEAAALSKTFMQARPELAAATIDQLLKQINRRFDVVLNPLNELLPHERLKKEAQAVLTLAETFQVANEDGLIQPGLDDEYLANMDIIKSRAYRVLGRPQEAVDLLGPQTVKFGDVLELIMAYGDANYDLGTSESLERARVQYRMVMGSYTEKPYPEVYYHAWLNYLKACIEGDVQVEDVPLYVGQLRMRDSELGGEVFKKAFDDLIERVNQ
ncbi:hypothetical protein KS4_09380 [Poriferisphaera corsica]|uniref:Tetratricopeptide repeat protein n=1 Tax=Poriferisphaera corsica TaxID=2528020 RepID=A0A517YRQ3_9BACT|nr:hypothetical protein [Poriferisphaera corsica]QDU32899.1 hypothetical protein KS4_09380 [Poriferisphaera corsica]